MAIVMPYFIILLTPSYPPGGLIEIHKVMKPRLGDLGVKNIQKK